MRLNFRQPLGKGFYFTHSFGLFGRRNPETDNIGGCGCLVIVFLVGSIAYLANRKPTEPVGQPVVPLVSQPVSSPPGLPSQPASIPETAPPSVPIAKSIPKPAFAVGDWVLLEGKPQASWKEVWLLKSPEYLDEYRSAQSKIDDPKTGPEASADRDRMSEAKRIASYATRSRAHVEKVEGELALVRIFAAQGLGDSGWVDMAWLRLDPNPVNETQAKQDALNERARVERERSILRKKKQSRR